MSGTDPRALLRRLQARAIADPPMPVADGVWRIRGGFPRKFANAYAIADEGGGVLLFDTGIKPMTEELRKHTAALGGLTRVVLGHGHFDHRGGAAGLDAPILCHITERETAESADAGNSEVDLSGMLPTTRALLPAFAKMWDGGPVRIAQTFEENVVIAGFRIIDTPGHSPGQVALFRESDRLALVSDTFYRLNIDTFMPSKPRLPPPGKAPGAAEQVRESIRKIAALEPSAAWPGHGPPLRGDVRAALEALAAS